jgi:hypothetical protein
MAPMKIAVILFAFNRPKYLKKCLDSIHLPIQYAYVDYSDKQEEICKILSDSHKCQNIIVRGSHFGLARNIIFGVTSVFNLGLDAVIVIEDDLILEPDFYPSMKHWLITREGFSEVGSVSGCSLGIKDYRRFLSWGWGTWKDRWDKVDWRYEDKIDEEGFAKIGKDLPGMYAKAREGKLDSWAVRYAYHHFKHGLTCLHPEKPLVKHIGRMGTHAKWYSIFSVRRLIRKLIG